jgi:HSP20 family protein
MRSLIPFPWRNDTAQKGELDPFTAMQREINRVFSEFGSKEPLSWQGAGISPRIDVAETDTAVEVTAELPGLDEKDFEVVLKDDLLTLKGEKKSEREEKNKDYHVVERSFGSFSRSIRLPFEADPETVKAQFTKGVLKVTVGKPAEAKNKTVKIPIRSN